MIRLNGSPINVTLFPDNTSQVWQLPENTLKTTNYASVTWDFSHEGEFLHLAQLKTLLDRYSFKTDLLISYLPYGRQDKEVSNSSTFALRTFANLLNSINFNNITIIDPHSNIAIDLINNSQATYPIETIKKVIELTEAQVICYPDKGAKEKYSKLLDFPSIYAEKVRNQLTGEIESIRIIGNPIDQNVLIVDDLCDGGGTFIGLMDRMLRDLSKETNLYVSHGIFSKGLKPILNSGIKRVFTKDGEVFEDSKSINYRRL